MLLVSVGFVASGLWYGFFSPSVLYGQPYWQVPGDIWATMRDAHYIAWGGFAAVYGTGAGLVALPGMPLLLAPVAALCSHLGLTEGFPFAIPHPTAWYVVGPVTISMGTLPLFATWRITSDLAVPLSRRRIATVAIAVGCWPAVAMWGHPEDAVALSLSLWGLAAALRGRFGPAGWLFGAAMAIQPLAVLALPLAVGMAGVKRSPSLVLRAALFPGLLLALEMVGDFHSTWKAFSSQPNYPTVDWPTPWLALAPKISPGVVAAGPGRAVSVLLAGVFGLWVGQRWGRGAQAGRWVLWAAGVAFALRCVLESVMVPYYVMPAVVCLVAAAAFAGRARLLGAGAAGAYVTVFTLWHYHVWPWYGAVVLSLGLLGWWSRPEFHTRKRPGDDNDAGDGEALVKFDRVAQPASVGGA